VNTCALPDTRDLQFIRDLEERYPDIRDEYLRLERDLFVAWPETGLYDTGWDVFGLYFFGKRQDLNCMLCPNTAAAVEAIPGMVTAGFSRLAPGTIIRPHKGYTDAVLRCHVGLVVPEDCALRVDGVEVTWQEGRCLLFDDTYEHEAWNHARSDRIVLLVDILRTALNNPA